MGVAKKVKEQGDSVTGMEEASGMQANIAQALRKDLEGLEGQSDEIDNQIRQVEGRMVDLQGVEKSNTNAVKHQQMANKAFKDTVELEKEDADGSKSLSSMKLDMEKADKLYESFASEGGVKSTLGGIMDTISALKS